MKAAAQTALKAGKGELKELRALSHCSVMGYDGGGFAVVTADEQEPRVVGICTTRSSEGRNPGFEWWLQAMNAALAKAPNKAAGHNAYSPDPKKFPREVEPLVKTHWGQMTPYNNLLPPGNGGDLATGCVATAMAQVLYYYRMPEQPTGSRTIYYPYGDTEGAAITADFGDHTYDWDNMVMNYRDEGYTEEQAEAVATLMRDCGVAADMRYGIEAEGGSGTAYIYAVEGFHNYLGMPDAEYLERTNYATADWMDIVFGELSSGHPVLYGGVTAYGGGHSFVVDGYDSHGRVHVNWGWNGDDEGYFDVATLNVDGTSFAYSQDMIFGLNKIVPTDLTVTVDVATPGTLAEQMDAYLEADTLVVTGMLNYQDIATLNLLAKGDLLPVADAKAAGATQLLPQLKKLDLSAASFEDGILPEKAFYGCSYLKQLLLPAGLKHIGDGAMARCNYLSVVEMGEPAEDADFVVIDSIIYNKEETELICALPVKQGAVKIPSTITAIHPYAFAGCGWLEKVDMAASITELNTETFRDCCWLEEMRVRSKTIPTLTGYDTFAGMDMSICDLYVPSGTKSKYTRTNQWKEFKSVIEYGTTVKAKNATRYVGEENPTFGFEIVGDAITGTPELYTDATIDSPAGVYTIYVLPGTITDESVEYQNAKLIVMARTTDIQQVEAADGTSAVFFDLQGRRLSETPATGIYMQRTADGRLVKRMAK